MNKTNYSINAKTALLLKQLICAVRVLMAITVILVICAQPCKAARVHSHKLSLNSNTTSGTHRGEVIVAARLHRL